VLRFFSAKAAHMLLREWRPRRFVDKRKMHFGRAFGCKQTGGRTPYQIYLSAHVLCYIFSNHLAAFTCYVRMPVLWRLLATMLFFLTAFCQ
jgi:hypothetical protein